MCSSRSPRLSRLHIGAWAEHAIWQWSSAAGNILNATLPGARTCVSPACYTSQSAWCWSPESMPVYHFTWRPVIDAAEAVEHPQPARACLLKHYVSAAGRGPGVHCLLGLPSVPAEG